MATILLVVLLGLLACLASSLSRSAVLQPFAQGRALKVISGLDNFNVANVKNVAWAASQGGASHVDIACDAGLVREVRSVCGNLPICVSSVKPADFVAAVEAGADMVEIGNFDSFYEKGRVFTAEDVVAMTVETRRLLPTIPLSVTIPHTLALSEQVKLAKRLEEVGADIIQTEGKMGVNPQSMGVQELIEKAAPTLASAFALSRAVSIPVMCASGLTDVTCPLAIAAGARGVGVGSMVNKLPQPQQMLMAVQVIAQSIGREPSSSATSEPVMDVLSTVSSAVRSQQKTV
jgi:thiamine monophosphate synthase